ncbi:hypothetical protein VaNZ11_014353, partial [Volvox africanus]
LSYCWCCRQRMLAAKAAAEALKPVPSAESPVKGSASCGPPAGYCQIDPGVLLPLHATTVDPLTARLAPGQELRLSGRQVAPPPVRSGVVLGWWQCVVKVMRLFGDVCDNPGHHHPHMGAVSIPLTKRAHDGSVRK